MMRADYRSLIGRQPLYLASAALLLAVLPLIGKLAAWVLVFFAGCAVIRCVMEYRGTRLPGTMFRLALAAGGIALVHLQYGTLVGLEAGLSVLLVLNSVKILEARHPRDFNMLVVLGWFLCLTQLFFYQDLLNCLYAFALFLLLSAALVQVHRRPQKRMLPSIRVAGALLLQALPLVLLLFLLFPRSFGGFRFQFSPTLFGTTGMSDRLYPGSVAAIATSDKIAFRVYFREGEVPTYPSLYWRGGVLWQGNGLNWAPDPELSAGRAHEKLAGRGIWQRIVIEPHGDRWLFALDWPADASPGVKMEPGNFLRSRKPLFSTYRYEAISRPANRETQMPGYIRKQSLELPPDGTISPKVEALVAGWRATAGSDSGVVEEALRFFRKGGFRYTLSPGTYSSAALDEFLFERREGFCEHFAGAFATLMRVAGIPSRVVVGYQGGEYNRHGNYVIVRQSDAHAWCEVWQEGLGWERVDPTTAIAPVRTNSGLSSYLESSANREEGVETARQSEGIIGVREMIRDLRLVWDTVNYQWDLRVLNFDHETQRTFLALLGLERFQAPDLLLWLLLVTALLLGGLSVLMRRLARPKADPVVSAYFVLCRKLARAGVPRGHAEGPIRLCDRAVERFPHQAPQVRALFDEYVGLRYGKGHADARAFVRAVSQLRLAPTGKQVPRPVE